MSAFELVAGFSEAVEGTPDEAVDGDNHQGHDDGGEQESGEVSAGTGGADLRAETGCDQRLVLELKIFRDN